MRYRDYSVGQSVVEELKLETIRQFDGISFSYYYDPAPNYLYRCVDALGNIFVWYTTKFVDAGKGSILKVQGKVKALQSYRGEDQIVLTRVKMTVLKQTETAEAMWEHEREEYKAAQQKQRENKIKDQKRSIGPLDEVKRVSYRDYKNKYPRCETIIDSYDSETRTIEIIIRSDQQ